MTDPNKGPGIGVGQVFLEAASFSHRSDFLSLPVKTKPDIGDVAVEVQVGMSADEKAGLVRIRVATKDEGDPVYRVSIQMAASFQQNPGEENMPLPDFLNGPAIAFLYPFVREAFANLTGRGRFGPVWLNPFNVQQASQALVTQYAASKRPTEDSAKQD